MMPPPQPFQIFDDYVIAVGTGRVLEPVQASDIKKALQAGKEIRLRYAEIHGDIGFFSGEVKQDIYFVFTTLTGSAVFTDARFAGNAIFTFATFMMNAVFLGSAFTGNADFTGAKFIGDAIFTGAKFTGTGAKFITAMGSKFTGSAVFNHATFAGNTNFMGARFTEGAVFTGASFTGDISFLGALKKISYNEILYLTVIKKYKEKGWLNEADHVYYDYRQRKRKNRGILHGGAELIFLEIPFGYGVKPWIFLRSFLFLWLAFSFYYVGFLRRPEDWFSHGIKPWYPFRDRWRCLGWALIHSLNILTPGIDLRDTRFMKASGYKLVKADSRRLVWVQRIQQFIGWYLLALFLVIFGKIWVR